MSRVRSINLGGVKDPQLRSVLITLSNQLVGLQSIVDETTETVTVGGEGLARTRAAIVPRVLPADPTSKSTYGVVGEIASFGDDLFKKVGVTGSDVNWKRYAGA